MPFYKNELFVAKISGKVVFFLYYREKDIPFILIENLSKFVNYLFINGIVVVYIIYKYVCLGFSSSAEH